MNKKCSFIEAFSQIKTKTKHLFGDNKRLYAKCNKNEAIEKVRAHASVGTYALTCVCVYKRYCWCAKFTLYYCTSIFVCMLDFAVALNDRFFLV